METIVRYLLERWETLSKAPDVFVLSVVIVSSGCYVFLKGQFKAQLESKNSIIEALKTKVDHKNEQLAETREMLARARTEQAATLAGQTVGEPLPTPPMAGLAKKDASVQRDVSVSAALAYAEFHQWDLRFIDAAGIEGNRVSGHLEALMQHAADGELTIWGKRSSEGVWQKVPAAHWLDYHIEWFGLLKSSAFTETRRSFSRVDNFIELMTSRTQIEQLFQPKAMATMQIAKVLAPSVAILKSRILDARDRFEAMEASDEQLAAIRQTMSSLTLSDDAIWENPALAEARQDLLKLWERLARNANIIKQHNGVATGCPPSAPLAQI